jgi:fumarylacetoacetate (FAA) hydrolase
MVVSGELANGENMKLASYKDGSRDGHLVVVSRDLKTAHYATGIATRLQQLLDDWGFLSPQLQDLYDTLNQGRLRHAFAFDATRCAAPLPRIYQWAIAECAPESLADGSGVQGAEERREPTLARRSGDALCGPCDSIGAPEGFAMACCAALAAVTGDVPQGATPDQALDGVRLLALVNDWSIQSVAPPEADSPQTARRIPLVTAFAPVAVTPEELGNAWRGGRLHAVLEVVCNGRTSRHDVAIGMPLHLGQLITRLCENRAVHAGSIVASGLIDLPVEAAAQQQDDHVRLEIRGEESQCLLGVIEHP